VRWIARPADPVIIQSLASELRIPVPLSRLLVARGIHTPEQAGVFLSPSLNQLHSPYSMLGMKPAVERLQSAIANHERVLIYGDYDVDGTTAIVILKTAIELCGGQTEFHVPHRILDGYGMKGDVIEQAAADGIRLIISVDTGIRAFAAADTASRLGVDLIVTDHHLPDQGMPRALAVLNPNQPDCGYPCKALCGAGVAFKLAQALLEATGRQRLLPSFIKMVAIATIADAVPLTGENRVFAKLGLDGLSRPVNPGLRAILEVAALDGSRRVNTGDIAFRVAPRLNAAGRMDIAQTVIELFTEKNEMRARELAQKLDTLNADRQQEEQRIVAEVEQRLESEPALREAYCIVVDGDGWHRGVIGIVATRVVERYCRPAIVLSRDGEEAHGSGRSIRCFHLLEALESCRELFTRFGGHAHAVGLGLPCQQIPHLRSALDSYARTLLTPEDFVPCLEVDGELAIDQVTPGFYQDLQRLQPFGMGNPEPVFVGRNLRILLPPRILKDKHIKLRFARISNSGNGAGDNGDPGPSLASQAESQDGNSSDGLSRSASHFSPTIAAMGWRMAEQIARDPLVVGDTVDVAFRLDHNEHPDWGGLELAIEDLRRTNSKPAAVSPDPKLDPTPS